jgi:hypothetical protein
MNYYCLVILETFMSKKKPLKKPRPASVAKMQFKAKEINTTILESATQLANQRVFIFWLVLIFTLGAFLRLYILSDQILVDDEWHSISSIISMTFWKILTAINPIDNSSPILNAYTFILLNTLGISETLLRLPVIIVGLISLIVLPLSVKKSYGSRVAIYFSALFAISPFLIFYSRFFRAYILIMFFSFWGLLSFLHWVSSGSRRYAIITAFCGGIATYLHPCSLIVVMVPFVITSMIICAKSYFPQFVNSLGIVVSRLHFFILFLTTAALNLLSILPIIAQGSELPLHRDTISISGLAKALSLLCGTTNLLLITIFVLLIIAGQVLILKRQPLTGLIFAGVTLVYPIFLSVTGPFGVGDGVVILRYMIPVIPMALLLVALALEHFCTKLEDGPFFASNSARIAIRSAPFAFVALLFALGPIPGVYVTPNNFTNHSAFQGSYEPVDWRYSDAHHVHPGFSIKKEDIPAFYSMSASADDIKTIIEYPYDVCNYNNLFYFYQHVDKKRRIAGFCWSCFQMGVEVEDQADEGVAIGALNADDILSGLEKPGKLSFSNMVDITNDAALSKMHDAALVLHKSLMTPKLPPGQNGFVNVRYRSVMRLIQIFRMKLGHPLYEDEKIVVFKIR